MTTALTVYYSNTASSTLSTANQLYDIHGTDNTNVTQNCTLIGNNVTGWGEIYSQGNSGAWAAAGSEPAPSGHGFLYDNTNLEGQQIIAGSWSANVRLAAIQDSACANLAGTLVADEHVRAYKRSSGGVYTLIVDMVLTTQTINSTITTYALSGSTGSATTFGVGDKLYIDDPANITTNSNANANQKIRLNRLSTDTTNKKGDSNAQVVTPGYQAAVTTTTFSSTDGLSSDDSATLYVEVGIPTDALTADDSATLETAVYLPADALTVSDSLLVTDVTLPVDALSASDSFSASGTSLLEDGLTVSENVLASNGSGATDGLSLVDTMLAVAAAAWSEPVPASESLLATSAASWNDLLSASDNFVCIDTSALSFVDLLTISDSFASVGVALPVESLQAVDGLLAIEQALWSEMLSVSDSLIVLAVAPRQFLSNAVLRVRTGKVILRARNGKAVMLVRNGKAIVKVREQ